MPQSSIIYDVAIVGYGPVGATFANLLSRYGLKIAVVEQAAGIYDKPRAITIDHEVLRIFQACGIADVMEKGIAAHPGTHYLGVDGEVIKIFDPMPPPYPLGWVPTATFVQPDVERALREKLAAYPKADVFLSTRAVAFSQDANAVSLTCCADSGEETILRSRYLVASDGANSFVRKQLGIGLDDLEFDEWWMVVDAFAKDLDKRPNKCFQYCWPSRPGTFLPGPGALRRWEIKLLPGEDPVEFGRASNVLRVLQGFTDTSDLQIWRSAVYRFHALLAQSWRFRRIFLMGDAVHQTPPFLGQGLSAGIRDAFNLAWKLAFVLKGRASDALLDTYEAERKPHVSAIVATAKEFGKIIGELDPSVAQNRDQKLRAELKSGQAVTIRQKFIPDLTSGFISQGAPLAGSLFVQPSIQLPHGVRARLDDLLPNGFLVVSHSVGTFTALISSSKTRLQWLSVVCAVIAREPPANVPEGVIVLRDEIEQLRNWLESQGLSAVVVRPDRYVFGAARDAAELDGLVREIRGRIQP